MTLRPNWLLSCGVAASTLALAQAAWASDFTIVNGQTVNITQTLNITGDVGTVEAGGTIDVPGGGAIAIEGTANGVTVDNAGMVKGGDRGINVLDSNTITNSGTVTGGGYGIVSNDSNTITNSGTTEGSHFGIVAYDNNTITNSGTARGIGATGAGILAYDNNTVINSGTAESGLLGIYIYNGNTVVNSGMAQGGVIGIYAVYDNNTITNSGSAVGGESGIRARDGNTITNSGTATGGIDGIGVNNSNTITNSGTATGGLYGVKADSSNTIANSGTMTGGVYGIAFRDNNNITNLGTVTGTSSSGISAQHYNTITNSGTVTGGIHGIFGIDYNTVTNSGTIVGPTAVDFVGTGNTLNLLAGSNIQGNLALGTGNTLNISTGLNTALAYTGVPTINTSGRPSYDSGSVIYVLDPTGFSAADEMVTGLTGIVTDAVDERLAAARSGDGAGTVAMNGMLITAVADVPDGSDTVAWLKALGGYRDQQADGSDAGFENLLGGLVAGVDGSMGDGKRAGLFIGATAGQMQTDSDSQTIDSGNYFAGAYAGFTGDSTFLDLSLTAGLSDFYSDRSIANNQVVGGIEHAKADYQGLFISPSVTLGSTMHMDNGGIFTPSLRARYAGLFLDSYDESGSAADLSVDSRDVNVFEVRGQLAYGLAPLQEENGTLNTTLRIGADGIFSDNGSIDASLLGNPLDFSANDGSDEALRGFVGFDAVYATTGAATFHVGAELGYDSNDAFTAQAEAGFEIPL
ncbi:MAG: autotransporter domain-containing protein [Aestuariivirga sp.]